MADVNVDTVIQAYVKLRDKRSEIKQAYDIADNALKAKMEKLEIYLLQLFESTNASQLGSAHGTAYKQVVMKSSCSDWPSFWEEIKQSDRFDLMEKRVSSKAIQAFYEENGRLPAGINTSSEIKVTIRRS